MSKRKTMFLGAVAALALAAGPVLADALADAQAGMDALNRGDSGQAIQLFSRALAANTLKGADLELAHVKRAEAYLAAGQKDQALADAEAALKLDPSDAEAKGARDKAKGVVSGPTIEVTLEFLRATLQNNPQINYTLGYNNTSNGTSGSNTFTIKETEPKVYLDACTLGFHDVELRDGTVTFQSDTTGLPFKDVSAVNIVDVVENTRVVNASTGHPELVPTVSNPPVYIVYAHRYSGQNLFYFYDQDIAQRFANAVRHAAEICGGLKPSPF